MKIVIIGAGGVGGYFGARWAAAGMDVTLLARGEHYQAIKADGIRVLSPLGDVNVRIKVLSDINQSPKADLVIVAIKSWQLEDILRPLKSMISPSTLVVGLQNGVEAAEKLVSAVGDAAVLGGTCRIISYIEQPGIIRHVGVEPTIVIGGRIPGQSERVDQLVPLLNLDETHQVLAVADIQRELWKKFLFFSPVSGLGAVTRSPIGIICSQPQTRALLKSAMLEVFALAIKTGVNLREEVVDATLKVTDTLPFDGTTSMQRDFAEGKRTELEALAGAMVRIGRQHQVATPVHDFIYASLLPLERRARGELEW